MATAADPELQASLVEAGMAGALPEDPGDFLALAANNGAAHKGDYFMDWNVRYEVWLEDGGDARAEVRVEGHNDLPEDGEPRYIIGPGVEYLDAGDNLTLLSVFCAPGCTYTHAEQDEDERWPGVVAETELGYTTLSTWQWAPSGGTTSVEYTLRLQDVWTATDDGGEYQLQIQTPPLARPAEAEVIIHPPHPLNITDVGGPATLESGQAVWTGTLAAPATLSVELQRPARYAAGQRLERYARNIRDFWSQPLLK